MGQGRRVEGSRGGLESHQLPPTRGGERLDGRHDFESINERVTLMIASVMSPHQMAIPATREAEHIEVVQQILPRHEIRIPVSALTDEGCPAILEFIGATAGIVSLRGDYTKVTYLHAKGEQIRYDASRCYSQAFLPLLCGAALRAPIWEGGNPIDQRSR